MKNLATHLATIAFSTFLAGSASAIAVQVSPAPTEPAQTTVSAQAPRLPYGVPDILKLTRAKVSDDVTIAYIQNSGRHYVLTASDIVYLRDQGVSDVVINALLNQAPPAAPTTAPTAAQPSVAAPSSSPSQAPESAPAATATAPQYAPASSVYVIPNSAAYSYPYYSYPYYSYYPYSYYPYRGYYPGVSFGFYFGNGGYHHGGYYGGWHGHYGGHYPYYGHGHGGGGGHPVGGHFGGGHGHH